MDSHDNELGYHGISKAEMIFNPKYYFYFDDIKFVSFPQLYQMKKNRGDVKDINDCKMMESLIENNWLKGFISKTKQILYYAIMRYSIKVLKAIGAYEIVRDIYKKIKAV